MAVIYIREQGSIVRKRGGRLLVEKEGEKLAEIRLRETDSVAIFGSVQVTTQALSELLDYGVPLALYTRNGRLRGHLAPAEPKNVDLRLAQYRRAADPAATLALATAWVAAKIGNCADLVADYRANYPSSALAAAEAALGEAAEAARNAANLETLLGVEGAAAARYWKAFASLNRSGLPFEGRNRRPPRDPLNALLSLGYSLLLGEIRSLLEGLGLEPHVGFLHRPDYGRPSLALDLLEPFRPVADRLALALLNRRAIEAEDFARDLRPEAAGRVTLKPEAFRRWLEGYEAALTEPRAATPLGVRAALTAEAEKFARALRENGAFQPWREIRCSMSSPMTSPTTTAADGCSSP